MNKEQVLVETLIEKLPDMEYLVVEGRPHVKTFRGLKQRPREEEKTRMVLFIAKKADRAKLIIGIVQLEDGRRRPVALKAFVLVDGKPIMLQEENMKGVANNIQVEDRRRIEQKDNTRKKATEDQCHEALNALGFMWCEEPPERQY